MTATAGDSKTTPSTSRGTDYVILEFNEDSDEWREHGDRVRASSGEAAIRKHVEATKKHAGSFVAVPARSFVPVKVQTETQTKIKLG